MSEHLRQSYKGGHHVCVSWKVATWGTTGETPQPYLGMLTPDETASLPSHCGAAPSELEQIKAHH